MVVLKTVVYADVLIFINTVVTFIIILTTSIMLNINSVKIRYLLGSFLGGFFSLIIFAPKMNLILSLITKLIICTLIVLISFKIRNIKIIIKLISGFYLISFIYAGASAFIFYTVSDEILYYNNGFTYFELNSFSIILVTTLIFVVLFLINRYLIKSKKQNLIFNTEIEYCGKKIITSSFYDSGNSVKDIYTGKPVIIIEADIMSDLLSEDLLNSINSDYYDCESNLNSNTALRLIPVKTLGETKLLPAFTADKAEVYNDSIHKIIVNPCIVLNENSFQNKNYNALINSDVLGQVI